MNNMPFYHPDDELLYKQYLNISIGRGSILYPDYVKIIGLSCMSPHPHKHFNFEEFIDKLYEENSKLKEIVHSSFEGRKSDIV